MLLPYKVMQKQAILSLIPTLTHNQPESMCSRGRAQVFRMFISFIFHFGPSGLTRLLHYRVLPSWRSRCAFQGVDALYG